MKKIWKFLLDNSLLLVIGAVIALVWANCGAAAQDAYHHILHAHFGFMDNPIFGSDIGDGSGMKHFDLHFFINDFLMAFFFMAAGKEVFEATFPGGALHNPKQAATPLIATAGGVLGPIGVYLLIALLFHGTFGYEMGTGTPNDLMHGWAVPTATDIAFSAMIARIIFGGKHPAVPA